MVKVFQSISTEKVKEIKREGEIERFQSNLSQKKSECVCGSIKMRDKSN